MRIRDFYDRSEPTISFEFYPPKTEEEEQALYREVVPQLKALGASYISVTYGAGGGTRATTFRIVQRIRAHFGVEAMAHLTCVGSDQKVLLAEIGEAQQMGIENILALRGDPPKGQECFKPVAG